MAALDDGDRRNAYQLRQDEQRPPGRKLGENRAAHRQRLRNEKRSKSPNVVSTDRSDAPRTKD